MGRVRTALRFHAEADPCTAYNQRRGLNHLSAGVQLPLDGVDLRLAVAHALQCPYCIDAFSQSCLEAGSNMEQMTEAIHMAAAIRGGAALIHGVQAHNSVNKVSM